MNSYIMSSKTFSKKCVRKNVAHLHLRKSATTLDTMTTGVCSTWFKAMPHDNNDLRNAVVHDAKSTMEFNHCADIIQAQMLTFDVIVTIFEFHRFRVE